MTAITVPVQGFKFRQTLSATDSDGSTALVVAPGKSRGGGIELSGTFSGTIQFEQLIGATWVSKTVYPAAGGSGVTSATGTGQWKFSAGGEAYFRVRCSNYVSGSIVVDVALTAGTDAVSVTIGNVSANNIEGSPTGGTAGSKSALVGGKYNATAPALTDGQQAAVQLTASGDLKTAEMSRGVVAAFSTLTRPANTTAYSASDSISDNATAGSVTALSATVSDINDAPVTLTSIEVDTNDTGLAAGVSIRAYVYNSDPTANSGVGGGDNAAFSNKRAGLVATFTGTFHAMSDGGKAFLAPEDTGPTPVLPGSGAKTLWIQYQTLGAFTPSANSTTLIGKAKGYQLRA